MVSATAVSNQRFADSLDSFFENVRYKSLLTGKNVVLRAPTFRTIQDTSCLEDDIHCVLEDNNIIDAYFSVNSAQECQYTCAKSEVKCAAFTWFGVEHLIFPNSCFLFSKCKRVRRSARAVSGPPSCSCSSHSACQGVKENFVKFKENVPTEQSCQLSCASNSRCKFYTWFGKDNQIFNGYCFLFSSCDQSSCNCKDCFSGPPKCFQYELASLPVGTDDGSAPANNGDRPSFPGGSGFQPPLISPSQIAVPSNSFVGSSNGQNSDGGLGLHDGSHLAVVNYMPALKWLLINIKNNKALLEEEI